MSDDICRYRKIKFLNSRSLNRIFFKMYPWNTEIITWNMENIKFKYCQFVYVNSHENGHKTEAVLRLRSAHILRLSVDILKSPESDWLI